jgi:toxin-antitoxin system PIN domain toxin
MIVPDVNLLVYAYNDRAPEQPRARRWLEDVLSGTQSVGFPWTVCIAYIRLVTNRRIVPSAITGQTAIADIRSWLACPNAHILQPGPRHLDILDSFAEQNLIVGDIATDAHLAALAIEHQAELHTNDGDFARFPGLRWKNPLREKS